MELSPRLAVSVWNNKGYTPYSLGRYEEAEVCYLKAKALGIARAKKAKKLEIEK